MKRNVLALLGVVLFLVIPISNQAQTVLIPGFTVSTAHTGLPGATYELTISPTGSIYYTDYNSGGYLYKVTPAGAISTITTNWASSLGQSVYYSDIELVGDSIYCHAYNGSIIKIDTITGMSTLEYTLPGVSGFYNGAASDGTILYTGEGSSTGASLYAYNTTTHIASVLNNSLPNHTFEGIEYCAATSSLYFGYTAYNATAGNYSGFLTKVNTSTGLLSTIGSIVGNANFAVDPYGVFAYYYDGSMVKQMNLQNGETKNFISGLSISTYYDMKFGPSTTGCGYSLFIGGGSSIYEVKGTGVISTYPTICNGNWLQISAANWGSISWSPTAGLDYSNNATPIATPSVTTTYTITNVNVCGTTTDTLHITVNPFLAPTVTLSAVDSLCSNAGLTVLSGGAPSGGVYSGIGVSGGSFNPASGVGNHTIIYVYTDGNGCANSDTDVVVVSSPPTVNVSLPPTFCELDAPFPLSGGTPAGGTYTGTGVLGGNFDPSIAGLGTTLITYHYSHGGCNDSASQNVSVISAPTSSQSPFASICPSGDPFPLTGGSPPGGSYSGPGVVDTTFYPALAGPGSIPVTYTYYDPATANYTLSQTGTFAPVSGTGTTVIMEDDTVLGPFPVGFHFNFYGINYNQFYISSNGFITFNAGACGALCNTGQILPTGNSNPSNLIAFAWANLDPSTNGTVRYMTLGTAPDRKLVVKFVAIPYYFSTNPYITSMVVMYESSNIIEIHTTNTNAFLNMTMGIMNNGGTNATVVPGRNGTAFGQITHDYVKFTPVNGCSSTSLVNIDVLPYPSVSAGSDVTIAIGQSTTLSGTAGTSTYSWSPTTGLDDPASLTPVATPAASTYYVLSVTDASGCVGKDTMRVTVFDYTSASAHEIVSSDIQIYPNPFFSYIGIRMNLLTMSDVSLTLCDLYGREVCAKKLDHQSAGKLEYTWKFDEEKLSSGIYFLKTQIADSKSGNSSQFVQKVSLIH